MSLEIIAIIISVFSALLAVFSLGWNVYRDVVLKPIVKIHFAVKHALFVPKNPARPYQKGRETFLAIDVTNFGPGSVRITAIFVIDTSLWKKIRRKEKVAIIKYSQEIGNGSKLPVKMEVGEETAFYLPYNKECILNEEWTHIGVRDTFQRLHLSQRGEVEQARKYWIRDFGPESQDSGV